MGTFLALARWRGIALLGLVAVGAGARADDYFFIGSALQAAPAWGVPGDWSPSGPPPSNMGAVVAGGNVAVPAGYGFRGPVLDVNATVAKLQLSGGAFLGSGVNGAPDFLNKSLTVTGTTEIVGNGVIVAVNGCVYDLGDFLNGHGGVLSAGAQLLSLADHGGSTTESLIEWKGADIIRNNGAIALAGPNSSIRNTDTGFSALLDFDTNAGFFSLIDRTFATHVDFTNFGTVQVTAHAGKTASFGVGQTFVNFDAGSGVLNSGTIQLISEGNGRAEFAFPGADIRTLAAGTKIQLSGNSGIVNSTNGANALTNLGNLGGDMDVATALGLTPANNQPFKQVAGTLNVTTNGFITVTGNLQQFQGATANLSGGSLKVIGNYTIMGKFIIDGEADVASPTLSGGPGPNTIASTGVVTGNGAISGAVTSSGVIVPGDFAIIPPEPGHEAIPGPVANAAPAGTPSFNTGHLIIDGDISLISGSKLGIGVKGTFPGFQYSWLEQTGDDAVTTLGGDLLVALGDGFEQTISPDDVFAVLTSVNTLQGAFDNVASGERLLTTDGIGTFLVTYQDQTEVDLSDFQPAPEPATLGVLACAGLVGLGGRRRRRSLAR
jgi:MYXO-CTERM domain-containing protein